MTTEIHSNTATNLRALRSVLRSGDALKDSYRKTASQVLTEAAHVVTTLTAQLDLRDSELASLRSQLANKEME